jgi:hypothetical protein
MPTAPVRGTVDALLACANVCTAGADACLRTATITGCVRVNLACAEACTATAWALLRHLQAGTLVSRELVEACAALCRAGRDACAEDHEQCRYRVAACEIAERACLDVLATTLDGPPLPLAG